MTARQVIVAGVVTAGVLQLPAAATVSAGSTGPHISVTPNNVMVNTRVTLKGRGFAKSRRIVLKECGATSWSVPQNPCASPSIRVHTGPRGRFTKTMTAKICPRNSTDTGPATELHCYVGEPKPSGIDTINLVGHAKLTVTYP